MFLPPALLRSTYVGTSHGHGHAKGDELDMRDPAPSQSDSGAATPAGVGFAPIDAARAPKIPSPTRPVEYYKQHSLAAQNWGAIGGSGAPMRQVSAEEARATVLRGLLDTPLEESGRSPREWALAVAIHVLIVAALVLIPLAFLEKIDSDNLQAMYLTMPRPPAPAPPPSAAELPARHAVHTMRFAQAITMPTAIPKKILEVKDEGAPEVDAAGAVPGGVAGGENGGVLGGVLGGMSNGPTPPPAPAQPPKRGVQRVGGDVRAPRQTLRVDPDYPRIAMTAKVEGVVVIDAVIDEHGNVMQARAVSGPGLLISAALQAVLKWKYEPTYLDGQAVPIEMKVEVGFHLH
jgi:periplasmic protein TonB